MSSKTYFNIKELLTLEGVVEILAVDRGAIDERRRGRRQQTVVTDRDARAIVVAGGENGLHVILVACGDREADHVDQQILTLGPDGIRQARHIERTNLLRQMLGNGGLGKLG